MNLKCFQDLQKRYLFSLEIVPAQLFQNLNMFIISAPEPEFFSISINNHFQIVSDKKSQNHWSTKKNGTGFSKIFCHFAAKKVEFNLVYKIVIYSYTDYKSARDVADYVIYSLCE